MQDHAEMRKIFLPTYRRFSRGRSHIKHMYLFARGRIGVNIVHSKHLDQNSSITERVANGSEPRSKVAQHTVNCLTC